MRKCRRVQENYIAPSAYHPKDLQFHLHRMNDHYKTQNNRQLIANNNHIHANLYGQRHSYNPHKAKILSPPPEMNL